MPITWAQAKPGLDPARFTVHSVPGLLRKSKAWADYDKSAKPFAAAAKRLAAG
jgi:bifunctional non-homologous end joining protein LigD